MQDSYVQSFLTQMVQERYGDDVELEFIETEVERLHMDLGDKLIKHFEPLLDSSSQAEFERLLGADSDMDTVIQFLFGSIDDLQPKIFDFLDKYKTDYQLTDSTND